MFHGHTTLLFVAAILVVGLIANLAQGRRGRGKSRTRLSEAPTWERISFPVFWSGMVYMLIIALSRLR